jgi:hypothetical protein
MSSVHTNAIALDSAGREQAQAQALAEILVTAQAHISAGRFREALLTIEERLAALAGASPLVGIDVELAELNPTLLTADPALLAVAHLRDLGAGWLPAEVRPELPGRMGG